MSDPFEILGIKHGVSMLKVEQAYKYLKELYSEDSLATYSMLDPDQRRRLLHSLDQAFSQIVSQNKTTADTMRVNEEFNSEDIPMPDPEKNPGTYLRWCRQRAGLSLKDMSRRIMVSSTRLEDIELERFDRLPAPVFVRGYIAEYVRYLNIDESIRIVENYIKLMTIK